MRIFWTVLLVLAFTATSATAASIYIKRNKDNALPDAPAEQPAPAPDPAPVPQAQAPVEAAPTAPAEETIEDFAERYMENCLKKQDPVLKDEALRMLCACSASKLQEKMTVDEVKTMMTDTPAGLAQRNRMAVYVYAPCMEYPAKALMLHKCAEYQANLKSQAGFDGEAICGCFANTMAIYTAANAQGVMAKQLTDNPNDPDPMARFLNSAEYKKQTDAAFMGCINSNGKPAQ